MTSDNNNLSEASDLDWLKDPQPLTPAELDAWLDDQVRVLEDSLAVLETAIRDGIVTDPAGLGLALRLRLTVDYYRATDPSKGTDNGRPPDHRRRD